MGKIFLFERACVCVSPYANYYYFIFYFMWALVFVSVCVYAWVHACQVFIKK